MGEENSYASLNWEAVIRTFLNEKRNAEENKYLKPILKSVTAEFSKAKWFDSEEIEACLLYTSPSPRDRTRSRMPSSA